MTTPQHTHKMIIKMMTRMLVVETLHSVSEIEIVLTSDVCLTNVLTMSISELKNYMITLSSFSKSWSSKLRCYPFVNIDTKKSS